MNQALSKIWIVVIILLIAGGILAWQYFGMPKGEVAPREEKLEITPEQGMIGRDIAREVDLQASQTALELYYSDYKKYPGEMGSNQWEALKNVFTLYDLKPVPGDPKAGHPPYEYWVSGDNKKYVLKATLEEAGSPRLKTDIDDWPLGKGMVWCGAGGEEEVEYCIGKGLKVTVEPSPPEALLREDEPAKKARDARRKADVGQMRTALEMYYMDQYPSQYPGKTGSDQWTILESVLVPDYLDYLLEEQKPGHPSYEYWVSSDNQKYILKVTLETHDPDLDNDIDGTPLGAGLVQCGIQGPNEREFCLGEVVF